MDGQEKSSDIVPYWIGKIQREEKDHGKFRKQGEAAERDYFDDRSDNRRLLFNIFFSTIKTLHSRLYSKAPAPDVRRRFEMSGPEGTLAKQAALLVERGISAHVDVTALHENADRAVYDFLITGLGVPWIEYKPEFTTGPLGEKVIASQTCELVYVPWKRFHWEAAPAWADVDWVARDHYLTAREIKQQFGEKVPNGTVEAKEGAEKGRHRVTEVWHRAKRKVYVIGWDFDEPLDMWDDELGLRDFFPCPRPMMANIKSRDLVPMPDHAVFAKGYEYCNKLVQRIHSLTAQIKAAGFYDAQMKELAQLATAEDGVLVPISNLAERLNASSVTDFSKVIATLPLREKVEVVRELQNLLAGEKARLDEATGIADVVRGATDPNETATAQQIKGQWAGIRLSDKSNEVGRCLRDAFRIMAEIMGEHFTPDSWYLLTGMRPDPQVLAILKSDLSRTLAIDVETDSTVAIEDAEEKKQKIEFLNYVTPFLQNMLPAIQSGALPGDVGKALLLFAIRAFKHGRELEDAIEASPGSMQQLQGLQQQLQQSQQQMQQQAAQAQQLQQQNQQLQGQLQEATGAEAQAKVQGAQVKAQAETTKAGAAVQVANLQLAREQAKTHPYILAAS